MRLQPIDVYILDYFRRSARARVDRGELSGYCETYECTDLDQSIDRLEQCSMLRRISDGREWLELTREGRRFAGLAAAESSERLEWAEA